LIFVAFVVKVMLETRGNREVALGVLQGAGAANVLVGLLAAYIPYLLLSGALYLAMVSVNTKQAHLTTTLAVVAVLVALTITPAWIVIVLVALLALLIAGRLQRRRARSVARNLRWRADWREVMLASQLIALTLYLVAPGMWLPPERVTVGGGTTEIAYVVEAGTEWTTVLREHDRVLLRFRSEAVTAREVCRLRPWPSPTIPQLLLGGGPEAVGDC